MTNKELSSLGEGALVMLEKDGKKYYSIIVDRTENPKAYPFPFYASVYANRLKRDWISLWRGYRKWKRIA